MISKIGSRVRRHGFALALVGVALFLTASASTQNQRAARRLARLNGHEVVDGEVLVKFRAPTSPAQQSDVDAYVETDESERISARGLRRMHSRRHDTARLLEMLRSNPDVEYAEPNYIVYSDLTPNDPYFANLYGLFNTNSIDIDAVNAWNYGTGTRNHVVGVVDTGIDYNHPDLAANVWSAPAQFNVTIAGQTITCAAGTHGFNAINRTCNPMDDQYHGTHVSGTIGGVGNNGVGVAGVNWTASIMGLKFLGSNGSGSTSDAVLALEFAIQTKTRFGASANVRVLNNSWGGGGYMQSLFDEISATNANEMLFAVAAGNSSLDNDANGVYPANYNVPNVVAVAATDSNDAIASFSDYGRTKVHLGAPGVSTLSTMPNNSYSYLSGTSMATPHVAGAASLVLSVCSTLTTAQLKSALLDNVDITSAMTGKTITGGRLNVGRAIVSCVPKVSSVNLSSDLTAPQGAGTTVTWTATPTGGIAPYQYKWLTYDGTAWTTAVDWTASNTFVWTPTLPNANYKVGVWVRSNNNYLDGREASTASAASAFAIDGVTQVALAANKTAPQNTATTITWTATPTGGTAPYEYKWMVYDGTSWTTTVNWSTTATYAWTPMAVNANWKVGVWVRSAGNTADAREASTATTFAITGVSQVTLAANKTAPQPAGTTVTWTASATGGVGPLEYKWLVYNGTTWTTVANWSTTNTFAWTPTTANANWKVGVWARSAGNTVDARESTGASTATTFAITVATQVALAANKTAPQLVGTVVTWTATASLGTPPYQYKWLVFDGTTWTTAVDWSTNATYAWTPTVVNANGKIGVWVRSAGNTVDARETNAASAAATFAAVGVESVTLTPDMAGPQTTGTTVTWTAGATGGVAPYQFKFLIYNGTSWSTAQGWSTTATFTWTPMTTNPNWKVGVWVRSAGDTIDARETSTASAAVVFPIQ